ncbi:MAG: phosphoribosylanthranilate isomerase, partial [Caldilineae bacterium]
MIVKICGITNARDAATAIHAGADMLGFICYPPSPRYVTPAQIAEILKAVAPLPERLRTVGVFVDASPDTIRDVMERSGLHLAQLHGGEPPAVLETLAGRAYKALRPTSLPEAEADVEWYAGLGPEAGPDLLVDAYHPAAYGGTGRRADWEIAAALAASCRLLLAGGLAPDNVAEAISRVRPWGVDVS